MTRQILDIGTNANDGTGDTLRSGGEKINDNFAEIYTILGGDSTTASTGINLDSNAFVYNSTNTSTLIFTEPTVDQTITIADKSGTIPVIEESDGVIFAEFIDSASGTVSKILYSNKYDSSGLLPSATTYHGMFAHVHNTGRGVMAHSGSWVNLVDSDTLVSTNASSNFIMKHGPYQTTFSNLKLVDPVIDTTITDGSNEILELATTGTPKNYLKMTAQDSSPTLEAVGDDPNINLDLKAKGSGAVNITKAAYSSSVMNGDGTVSDSDTLIIFNGSGAIAATLNDGTLTGEYKIFLNKNAGLATVTPTNFANGTNFALSQYGSAQAIWEGSNWYLIGHKDSADTDVVIT